VDFWGAGISLRAFDPETQRSTGTVPEIRVLPARESPLTRTAINALEMT